MAAVPALDRDGVAHLAQLSRIALRDDELDRLAGQIDGILDAVSRVSEVAGADVPPTSHPLPLVNVLRADEPTPSLAPADALAAAPAAESDRFLVPRILDEE
jgi:aspartyl-tRNA(Asn)/glutamyl-tRNA(Gln) amidotransferase subunit C